MHEDRHVGFAAPEGVDLVADGLEEGRIEHFAVAAALGRHGLDNAGNSVFDDIRNRFILGFGQAFDDHFGAGDHVTAGIDAIVYFRVVDPAKAVLETTNYTYATSQFAQAALRDVTGNFELDELLQKREEISDRIKEIVDAETSKWGIDIENVKMQNIELPQDMKRAMAKQAEAERERRANIISADGEKLAAQNLADAAAIFAKVPGALNLRTLGTLERISTEPSQKTMMLFPVELIDALRGASSILTGNTDKKG